MDVSRLPAILWRQRVVVIAVLAIGAILFGFVMLRPKKWTSTATILAVPAPNGTASLNPGSDGGPPTIGNQDLPGLLRATTLLHRVGAKLQLDGAQLARLAGSVSAKVDPNSNVVPITVTDPNPSRARSEANAVVDQLQIYEREVAMSRYDLLIADLKAQLAARRAALDAVDKGISAITSHDPYASAEGGTDAVNSALVALEAQRNQAAATLRSDTASAATLAKRPALTVPLAREQIIAGDPVFQSLRGQYGKDLAQLQSEQAGYTAAFPGLKGLADQVHREDESLARSQQAATRQQARSAAYTTALLDANQANARVAADAAGLAQIDGEIAGLQDHLRDSGSEAVELAALTRDRTAGTSAYTNLYDRLAAAQADRAQAASINSIVILDPAEAPHLSLLSRPTVLATAFGIAFVWLAITLAVLADSSDRRLTRARIAELYGGPVVGKVG